MTALPETQQEKQARMANTPHPKPAPAPSVKPDEKAAASRSCADNPAQDRADAGLPQLPKDPPKKA